MKYKAMLFDLDDTLYSGDSGLWIAIKENIYHFMIQKLGIPADEVHELRETLFKKYGTTFKGLSMSYEFEKQDYMDFVHNVPLEDYISKNVALRNMLVKYPVKKYIFTNADANHARRVTDILGVRDLFEKQIIDVLDMFPYCKPMPEAFEHVRSQTGNYKPDEIVFVDDSMPNIETAHKLGFQVVWMNRNKDGKHALYPTIQDILELPNVLPTSNGK
ncbi:MAG: pyrimidine 5'-nucleotidase [Anaerolineaceae bacterium]|nr:pyrimidine 5'-nucleotidase [Anaerolineaceae bacterium]